jgi:hypothetical protein
MAKVFLSSDGLADRFGATHYRTTDQGVAASPKSVAWEETEEQAEWRRMMDPEGNHTRLSELSSTTVGDARTVANLEAAAQYEIKVQEQVAAIKQQGGAAEDADDEFAIPDMPEELLGSAAQDEAVLEIASAAMLARFEASIPAKAAVKRATVVAPTTPRSPTSRVATEVGPLGNRLEEESTQSIHSMRQLFTHLDKDGDGVVGEKDLGKQYHVYEQKMSRTEIRELIFEVDDDGDGAIGWDEFSNLWMRTNRSLGPHDASQPMRFFNLANFVYVDLMAHPDGPMGRIPNTKMLEVFDRRYGNLAALELMDETAVGDTALGVTFASFVARATKLHEALFMADMLTQGPDVSSNEVSRKKSPKYKKSAREIKHKAVQQADLFISITGGAAGVRVASPARDGAKTQSPQKPRGRRKKAIQELFKWTAMPREQQAMLEMFCRKGDVKELLLFLNPVLSKFSNYKSRATLMIEISELLIKEVQGELRDTELEQLLAMIDLIRTSKRVI